MPTPKVGDIFYRDKQFIMFVVNKHPLDSGISCILNMSGRIETLSLVEEYLEEVRSGTRGWVHVGNLTDMFRKAIDET
jgi:hypothetical protein